MDAAIWTALLGDFTSEARLPAFSLDAAITYVNALEPAAKAKAAEYLWRALDFVQTPLRSALENQPWFVRFKPIADAGAPPLADQ